MSVNIYHKGQTPELLQVANKGYNATWTGTKQAAEEALAKGEIKNGTVVYITDDYNTSDSVVHADTADKALVADRAIEAEKAERVIKNATDEYGRTLLTQTTGEQKWTWTSTGSYGDGSYLILTINNTRPWMRMYSIDFYVAYRPYKFVVSGYNFPDYDGWYGGTCFDILKGGQQGVTIKWGYFNRSSLYIAIPLQSYPTCKVSITSGFDPDAMIMGRNEITFSVSKDTPNVQGQKTIN